MCLSWIDTPWSRYTRCTSSTRYCWVSRTPLISRSFFGSSGLFSSPTRRSPACTSWPSRTPRCARRDTAYSSSVPSSADHRDDLLALLVLAEPDHSGDVGHQRRALRGPGLEQLDHAGQTVGDVLTRDTTGVERTHRELGSRLTDRLRGDDTDRLAEIGDLAGREHAAVAARAHTGHRLAGEHRTHTHARDVRVVGDQVHPVVVDFGVARDDGAVGQREVFGEAPAEQARLEQTPALGAGQHVLDPDPADRVARDLAHDQLLGDVDESTGQVAGVGGTERGVGQTLACAVRRDEVLEHRQAFTEVALDRAGDDLTASGWRRDHAYRRSDAPA